MSAHNTAAPDPDLEPGIAALLDKRTIARAQPPYAIATADEVRQRLLRFLNQRLPGATVTDVERLSGGASKEQFVFGLHKAGELDGRYVLRMDPLEGLAETDRRREFEALRAFQGVVPTANAIWLDAAGEFFGRPTLIMTFRNGVTRPRKPIGRANVSGTGILLQDDLRRALAEEFIHHLVAIHSFPWRAAELPSFSVPDADPFQAARWRINLAARIWREDVTASTPIAALADRWLRAHLPKCSELVFVHGDYRTGNYLFDESSGEITAILDWELCHLGDFHEDLAWTLQRVCGSSDGRRFYCCGLLPREELIHRYERQSGRTVNRATLHFYEVLMNHQIACMVAATGPRAVQAAHSHQDVLLTWSAGCGHVLHSELCRLLAAD